VHASPVEGESRLASSPGQPVAFHSSQAMCHRPAAGSARWRWHLRLLALGRRAHRSSSGTGDAL